MQAAVFHSRGSITVDEVVEPRNPGPGEVLVRPQLCGICGTDLHEYTDGPIVIPVEPHPLNGSRAPQILGHEFSAIVEEVGAGVTNVRAGDLCAVMPLIYCGECDQCRRGANHLCRTMACTGLSAQWGGLAGQAIVKASQLVPIPEGVSALQAALIEPSSVAAYGVDRGHLQPGETVFVTGAGPIGSLATMYALAGGARRVIISESDPVRLERAKALGEGLGEVIGVNPVQEDLAGVVSRYTSRLGVDLAIECAGKEAALQACMEAAKPGGRVVQTALHVKPASISAEMLALKDLTLTGTWCFPVYDFPRVVGLVATGRWPVERVVSSVIPLTQVVQAGFESLIRRGSGEVKVLVEVAQ
ncbi:MAG: 2,3-butanediol dehydrogenase [Acidimicrobiaceae bacterium]|nr:2,3-butanediol dehydrogenase [Acidimicrobiaceae bacterium]